MTLTTRKLIYLPLIVPVIVNVFYPSPVITAISALCMLTIVYLRHR